jgi:hypothetical protein
MITGQITGIATDNAACHTGKAMPVAGSGPVCQGGAFDLVGRSRCTPQETAGKQGLTGHKEKPFLLLIR